MRERNMMREEVKATFPWLKTGTDVDEKEIQQGLGASVPGLEADGQLSIYDIDTGSVVACYEGLDVYKALIVARYIIEAAHDMIDVQPVVDQDTLRLAKAMFDKVFEVVHE